jgi:hypothetical protein
MVRTQQKLRPCKSRASIMRHHTSQEVHPLNAEALAGDGILAITLMSIRSFNRLQSWWISGVLSKDLERMGTEAGYLLSFFDFASVLFDLQLESYFVLHWPRRKAWIRILGRLLKTDIFYVTWTDEITSASTLYASTSMVLQVCWKLSYFGTL